MQKEDRTLTGETCGSDLNWKLLDSPPPLCLNYIIIRFSNVLNATEQPF